MGFMCISNSEKITKYFDPMFRSSFRGLHCVSTMTFKEKENILSLSHHISQWFILFHHVSSFLDVLPSRWCVGPLIRWSLNLSVPRCVSNAFVNFVWALPQMTTDLLTYWPTDLLTFNSMVISCRLVRRSVSWFIGPADQFRILVIINFVRLSHLFVPSSERDHSSQHWLPREKYHNRMT